MRRNLLASVLYAACALVAAPAFAQSAIPFGYWATAGNISQLTVDPSGQCTFFSQGGAQLAGNCTWDSFARGGILTIWVPSSIATTSTSGITPVRYNVVWVDNATITVWGEPFYLR